LTVLARVLIAVVKAYRLLLSPALGSSCRFEPTCSLYAIDALQQYGAARGSYLTLKRIGRCHPWCDGGLDPVPPARAANGKSGMLTRLLSTPPEKSS